MTVPFTPLDPRGTVLGDEVYSRLGEAILDGTLAPGERLRDQELAERLGVSRTPVREALQRLERTGLVEVAPNRYTRVTTPNDKVQADVYELVVYLMGIALRMSLSRCSDEVLADALIDARRDDRGIPSRRSRGARAAPATCSSRRSPARREMSPSSRFMLEARDRHPSHPARLASLHRVPDRPDRGLRIVPGCRQRPRRRSCRVRAPRRSTASPDPQPLATVSPWATSSCGTSTTTTWTRSSR